MKRSNEFAVGLAVLTALALVIGGALWLSETDVNQKEATYTARFRTVGGLGVGAPVTLRGVFSRDDPTCDDCELQLLPGGTALPATFDASNGTVTFTAPAGSTDFAVALAVGLELIAFESLAVAPDGQITTARTTSIPVARKAPTVTRVSGCVCANQSRFMSNR